MNNEKIESKPLFPSNKPTVPAIAMINLIEQIACGRDMSMEGAMEYMKQINDYLNHRLKMLNNDRLTLLMEINK